MSIREPINLKDLMDQGVIFSVNPEDIPDENDRDSNEDIEYQKNLLKFMNMEIAGGIHDEDTYVEGQPFENIAAKMFNLTDNGEIKKRILRDGYGDKPQDSSIVRIHYNAYIEYNAEPFDSTYARKKPQQFKVNCGEVIYGLDLAVQSMLTNEKSQFIITPEYAYGKYGCLERVPADAEVLFEIELLQIVNISATATFESLSSDEQKQFCHVYEYALALCAKAKDIYQQNVYAAIKQYNMAASKLEMCFLENYDDQVKQQELLMKLYSNLLVAFTKIEKPRKGCINFNKINEMVKGTDLNISAKIFYNSSKCLRMLGDYKLAKKRLDMAFRLESRNPEILNEMLSLDKEIEDSKKRESQMAKSLVKGSGK